MGSCRLDRTGKNERPTKHDELLLRDPECHAEFRRAEECHVTHRGTCIRGNGQCWECMLTEDKGVACIGIGKRHTASGLGTVPGRAPNNESTGTDEDGRTDGRIVGENMDHRINEAPLELGLDHSQDEECMHRFCLGETCSQHVELGIIGPHWQMESNRVK
jgi:hypothetical protein